MNRFIKLHCIDRAGTEVIRYANIDYIAEVVELTDAVKARVKAGCSVFYSDGNNILPKESVEEVFEKIKTARKSIVK